MSGIGLLQNFFGADLVFGVQVTMKKQDSDRFDAETMDLCAERSEVGLVQWRQDLTRRQRPFLGLEAQRPFDQGLVFLKIKIVGIGPVYPPNLIYITESFGGDKPLSSRRCVPGWY